ncbi:uncharacterized protein N7518_009515 [Penicillium psychrosexuale]|uniref:uncharacterized protein n=1 Tax=Penicillium psychrosexuale TaxID=1002107 RepID=UPI0025458585|nr:uncharacterized protein N7518_009515 [Penicillium psychrosexuale]KAJ5783838.1 hypothetical protein N7518_009515 [Penicillium psychrosexuale]
MQQVHNHRYSQKPTAIRQRPRTSNSQRSETNRNTANDRRALRPPVEKPGLYLNEKAVFLWDKSRTMITTSSIRRARQHVKERNTDLLYLHNLSDFQSYHLVYVDESRCDKRTGFRRTGWSPLGVAPLQVSQFHRDQRYQILPAYAQDGIILSRVFRGATDGTVFEDS